MFKGMKMAETSGDLPILTIWYNAFCPICKTGIGWQQKRLQKSVMAGAIDFRDLNLEPDILKKRGVDTEAIRKRLHGQTPDGELFVGADCVIEIWRRTPGDRRMARFFGLPGLRQVTRFGYNLLAESLYFWNRKRGNW